MTLGDDGLAMRDRAAGILRTRYATLLERSKRRRLTDGERAEVLGLERALQELASLHPTDAERPSRETRREREGASV